MDDDHRETPQLTEATEKCNIEDSQLKTGQSYQGKGESYDDDVVPSRPGKPFCVTTTNCSVTLAWAKPQKGSKHVDHYEIKYRECHKNEKWKSFTTEGKEKTATIENLRSMTDYEFKVGATNKNGEVGRLSDLIGATTISSLATAVFNEAKIIKAGTPSLYKLPLQQDDSSTNKAAKTRKCRFGPHRTVKGTEKTIMLVGATGAGKSTLIDGMINYITGVSWEDDFRFTLVDLTDEEKSREKEQTEWITCYDINPVDGSNIGYNLNIIDTPGFGDTRGITRDKAIVDQIREFFTTPGDQDITCLDAVCFVTQAPLARLTPSQKYIFDSILAVFGQDIIYNIFVLITFADGNNPPVCDALKSAEVPFQKYFKFNNSALFAQSSKADEARFGNLFWKMGIDSFQIVFDELGKVSPISLQLTTEVLKLRKFLEATVQGLQPQITEGINNLYTIRQEQEVLKRHKTDIEANRNFHYEVEEIHMRKIDLEPGTYVTNCMTCNRTCHFPCAIPDDGGKAVCAAMNNSGYCNVCPLKCYWQVHKNNSFRFETYPVKVKKTYDELKQKYETAAKGEERQKYILSQAKSSFKLLGNKVMNMVKDVRGYINKLNKIALRPNPLSDVEYIYILIESERSEKKYEWEARVQLFQKMRKEAELLANTTKANYTPWDDEDILNDNN